MNAVTGEVLPTTRVRQAVNAKGSAEEILDAWREVIAIAASAGAIKETKIGIAVPGPFDYEGGICLIEAQDKFRVPFRLNVKEALAQRLKISPTAIRFINDAAAFLQGEVLCGAGRGRKDVLGLTLGTGLGSALCTGGICADAGLWQAPFKEGLAEDYFSSRWFIQRYRTQSGRTLQGVKEIAGAMNEEEKAGLFSAFSINLGEFLLPLIREHKPKAVIFGGNISQAKVSFFPGLEKFLRRHRCNTALLGGLLGEDAALLGAAGCRNASPTADATAVKVSGQFNNT